MGFIPENCCKHEADTQTAKASVQCSLFAPTPARLLTESFLMCFNVSGMFNREAVIWLSGVLHGEPEEGRGSEVSPADSKRI